MAMALNADVQGVLRGGCTVQGCDCSGYFGGEKRLKCEVCKHPPVKHENLSTVARPVLGTQSYAQAAARPQYQSYSGYQSTGIADHEAGRQHYVHHDQVNPSSSCLPTCKADGCDNPVHHEPDVGFFDHCSPACRDRDLLEKDRNRLMQDLQRLAQDLRAAPPKSTSFTPTPKNSGSYKKPKGTDIPQQVTREVHFQKIAGQGFGVVIYDEIYILDHIKGFLVTGVEVRSKAYEMLKKSELQLLDIVTHMNSSAIEGLGGPIDEVLKTSGTASLVLNRTIAVGCSSSLFNSVERTKATHIIVLMNPNQFGHREFGFGVEEPGPGQEGLRVTSVEQGKVARHSGLKYGDSILSFAVAAKELIEKPKSCLFRSGDLMTKLQDAFVKGKEVVLIIQRRR